MVFSFVVRYCLLSYASVLLTTTAVAQVFPGSDFVGVSFPTTASIQRFVAHNNTFFALTSSGAFQTNNGGQDWREIIINGHKIQAINSFNNHLYACTDSTSYFVSLDNASTWLPSIIQMAEHFVTSSGAILKIKNSKLLRSTDAGISWSVLFDRDYINSIAIFQSKIHLAKIAPGLPGYRDTSGCFISSDDGNSWLPMAVQRHFIGYVNPIMLTSFAGTSNTTLFASTFGWAHILGTYCGVSRSPGLYRLTDSAWELVSPKIQLDKIYSYGNILFGLSKAECNDGWTNGGVFISSNGIDWQSIQQRQVLGTFLEWCSSCFDPYIAGFDNNGIVYVGASQIAYSGPPLFRADRQAILLRSLKSITTSVAASNNEQSVIIAPNPASSSVVIQGKAEHTGVVTIRLVNSVGAVVLAERITVSEGATYYRNVDIQHLPAGMYIVEAEENNQKTSRKLVKQ